jgi:hypothetical protein
LDAIRDGINLLTWVQDGFGFADSYDDDAGRYKGLRAGTMVSLADAHAPGLVVKPDVASRQLEAERPASAPDGLSGLPLGDDNGTTPIPPGATQVGELHPLLAAKPKRFHGTAILDTTRVGRDASRIADEVISHLAGLVGARVTITIEVDAEIPSGTPDQVVRIVTENSRTLKFTSHGFEKE